MRVVAFGPHPDDVDLYAGGLVSGLTRRGAVVTLVDLTRGELGTRGDVRTRASEAARAAEILGADRETLGLPDGGLNGGDAAQTRVVVEVLRAHRPALVIAPWEHDLHPDHGEACRLIRRAHFLARVRHTPADGEPYRPGPILYYEQKLPFEPDLVVDISPDIDTKREAIRAFDTQFFRAEDEQADARTEISDPAFHEMLEARCRVHGYRIGAAWGEGYRRDGAHPIHDPLELLPAAERPRAEANA